MTLYMFRTVFPSIIRSTRLYIQQQAFVKQILYVQSCTPDYGQKDCLKHVQCHSNINKFDTLVHLIRFTIGINWLDYFLKNILTHGSVVSQEWIG